ncbi:MAG: carbohydrate kinase [Rhodobacteraceae bacterium]|nr:carbohydrate kinase [Paracoccaceae bacterium]
MILCCGEALIDMIPSGGGPMEYRACPGGAALNAALALGRLGQNCGLVAGISTDPFGSFLEQTLRDNAVDTSTLIRSDRPTTLAFVHLQNGDASYSFYDQASAGRKLQVADLPDLPVPPTAMLMGGISLASDPCGATWEALAGRSAGNTVLMLDPNIRSALITDPPRMRARLERMLALADIVKVSEEDLDWLAPGDPEQWITETARQSLLLVSRGERGASAYTPKGLVVEAAAPESRVVDTVAAGDTFNAAFLTWLSENGLLERPSFQDLTTIQLERALSFACSVASLSVERRGANPPWRGELL